jgi:hypothetical protein
MNIFISRESDKMSVIRTEPTDTQSPWRGRRLPKKILIAKANKGKKRIRRQKSVIILPVIIVSTH